MIGLGRGWGWWVQVGGEQIFIGCCARVGFALPSYVDGEPRSHRSVPSTAAFSVRLRAHTHEASEGLCPSTCSARFLTKYSSVFWVFSRDAGGCPNCTTDLVQALALCRPFPFCVACSSSRYRYGGRTNTPKRKACLCTSRFSRGCWHVFLPASH